MSRADLVRDLAGVVNRHSIENDSNTPDFILAEFLADQLDAFKKASRQRECWYGHKLEIGGPTKIVEGT